MKNRKKFCYSIDDIKRSKTFLKRFGPIGPTGGSEG